MLVAVHPAFRILATAEVPTAWTSGGGGSGGGADAGVAGGSGGWLGSEVLSLFHYHHVAPLTMSDHSALVTANLHRRSGLQASSSSTADTEATATKLLSPPFDTW